MNDFTFGITDVADLLGVEYDRKGSGNVRGTCPFCGQKNFYISKTANTYNCFGGKYEACDAHGGMLDLFANLRGVDRKEAIKQINEALYGNLTLGEAKIKKEQRIRQLRETQTIKSNIRSVEDRNKTYTTLLSLLTLSKEHKDNLLKRGLTEEAIEKNGYRTYPIVGLKELAFKCLEAGVYLDGIPGFFKENNEWLLRPSKRGIIIPVRNNKGLISGFQIRRDAAVEPKYIWLSTKDHENGTGAESDVHFAIENGEIPEKAIYLTEGPLKADIAHLITHKAFISLQGVGCQKRLPEALKWLRDACGVKKVVNCFDMDYETNENVRVQMERSYKAISELGLEPLRLEWDHAYKGIDDYLTRNNK